MQSPSQNPSMSRQDFPKEPEPALAELWAEGRAEFLNPAPGRIKRVARWFYDRFVRLHGSPGQTAWGAALGLFVAMSPTMGFQMAIAISLAAFFKVSKVAAAAAVWLTNPVTAPIIYLLNYKLGAKLLGYPLKAEFVSNPSWETFWHAGTHAVVSLTLGGVITGIIIALPAYFVTLTIVTAAREKARRLIERKKQK
jgi:uncharacterized protein (DUF2062 family)